MSTAAHAPCPAPRQVQRVETEPRNEALRGELHDLSVTSAPPANQRGPRMMVVGVVR